MLTLSLTVLLCICLLLSVHSSKSFLWMFEQNDMVVGYEAPSHPSRYRFLVKTWNSLSNARWINHQPVSKSVQITLWIVALIEWDRIGWILILFFRTLKIFFSFDSLFDSDAVSTERNRENFNKKIPPQCHYDIYSRNKKQEHSTRSEFLQILGNFSLEIEALRMEKDRSWNVIY